jgi:hypothetical protein
MTVMRAEVPDHLRLSGADIAHLELYAERLLREGKFWPGIDEDVAVVEVCAIPVPDATSPLDIYGVRVHMSEGRLWQTSRIDRMAKPVHELPNGLYALARLRGTCHVAQMDVLVPEFV